MTENKIKAEFSHLYKIILVLDKELECWRQELISYNIFMKRMQENDFLSKEEGIDKHKTIIERQNKLIERWVERFGNYPGLYEYLVKKDFEAW